MFMKKQDNDDKYEIPSGFKSIKEWSCDDRPREKMIKFGAETLSTSELLAVILSTGTTGVSAIDLARSMLERFADLTRLSSCTIAELKKFKGIGDAKAVSLAAVFELGKRIKISPFDENVQFVSPRQIADYFIPKMANLKVEIFVIGLLNASNRLFREVKISEGILNASIVHPREVFREAIAESAASVVLVHNHPSGNPEPSRQDIEISKQLEAAGNIIDIKVLDHIIIAGDNYTSMKQRGMF